MGSLQTKGLGIGYEKELIRDICIEAEAGRIVTLIGPNGSGKSTLLKTLAGELKKWGGCVLLDGKEAESYSGRERAQRLSVMTTERIRPELMSCREVVAAGRYPYTGRLGILGREDEEQIDKAMLLTDTQGLAERNFENLSDGQRQRVMLARAICQEPEVLLLDEPGSFLDIRYRLDMLERIRRIATQEGIAVIMSLHELETAMHISDVVVALGEGGIERIGSPAEVFEEAFIRRLYGLGDADISLLGSRPWLETRPADDTACAPGVIMIQGTMSNAGKSVIAAGLCRIFAQDGYRVAPFKSQNMALNSAVTKEGLEMGRAQVMQAECCGIAPRACMNPILLKPTGDKNSQVILNGRVYGNLSAAEYFRSKKQFLPEVKKAYEELRKSADIIVVEGAGSPVELNLKENDIVNMGLAELINAPVLLVGDIDPGGVFAQLIGTVELLKPWERRRVKGLIVNKFRGDRRLFDKGVQILEEKSGVPVVGVVPYGRLQLDDEDSLSGRFAKREIREFDIAVIRFPRISNFTDMNVFEQSPSVSLRYVDRVEELADADLLILPGSKNTIADLCWLKESGLAAAVKERAAGGSVVFGLCGGYQMLGRRISDPEGVEGGGEEEGLGLLPIDTVLRDEKTTCLFEGRIEAAEGLLSGLAGSPVQGYEMHMGSSLPYEELCAFTSGGSGYCRGNVYGTYVHGFFDEAGLAKKSIELIAAARGKKLQTEDMLDHGAFKEREYDRLAELLRGSLDMKGIYAMMGIKRDEDGTDQTGGD